MSLSDDIADTCRLEASVANEEVQPLGVNPLVNLRAAAVLVRV